MNQKEREVDMTVALAGNPNVGKSTVFNALTGMHQHTGNWTGKTVQTAMGYHEQDGKRYRIVDLPGCYSLCAHSAEEECARDFLCFGRADGVIIVCDATHLERNLGLVLQILEIAARAVVVLNLMDEAKRLRIDVDPERLSRRLGVPVVAASAVKGEGIHEILSAVCKAAPVTTSPISYTEEIESAVACISDALIPYESDAHRRRFFALRLLEGDFTDKFSTKDVENATEKALSALREQGITREMLSEEIASHIMRTASSLSKEIAGGAQIHTAFSRADRILTSRILGVPIMLALLIFVFWLTAVGANFPSSWLSSLFSLGEKPLLSFLSAILLPPMLCDLIVYGVYRTLTWIVSVMLPPMLIFFPLFTILEDVGYLPRVAFNLDGVFCRCGACGKQGLTMCMGLGCNAVGVTGARIIDSRRERLLAILTNAFIPCNGRFPAILAISALFFAGMGGASTIVGAVVSAAVIALGVCMTFVFSWLLSRTLLRGESQSFILELPPYRRPQLGRILVRSFLDRTLFILGRAVTVAIPAGVVIWLVSHIEVGGGTVAAHLCSFLDPIGRCMGVDGVILLAFCLGLPANEIVLPLCMMLYRADGVLSETAVGASLMETLVQNGWTWQTAVCFLILTVMHSPCATTLLSVRRETGQTRWMLLAFLIPTVSGVLLCMLLSLLL